MCSAAVNFFSSIFAAIAHRPSATLVDELKTGGF
jgi:hypothetical protein